MNIRPYFVHSFHAKFNVYDSKSRWIYDIRNIRAIQSNITQNGRLKHCAFFSSQFSNKLCWTYFNWVLCVFNCWPQNLCSIFNAHTICCLFDSTFEKLVEINATMIMAIKRLSSADTYQKETSSVDTIPKKKTAKGETKLSTPNRHPPFSRQTFMTKLDWHDNANDH